MQIIYIYTKFFGKTILELEKMSIRELLAFLEHGLTVATSNALRFDGVSIAKEIIMKLEYLCRVGLPYITLSRPIPTLSGGKYKDFMSPRSSLTKWRI